MSEEDELSVPDPFLMGSTLRFAENEEETAFPSKDGNEEDTGYSGEGLETHEGMGSVLVESIFPDGALSFEGTEGLPTLDDEEDDTSFGELPEDQMAQRQFMIEQAKVEQELKMTSAFEINTENAVFEKAFRQDEKGLDDIGSKKFERRTNDLVDTYLFKELALNKPTSTPVGLPTTPTGGIPPPPGPLVPPPPPIGLIGKPGAPPLPPGLLNPIAKFIKRTLDPRPPAGLALRKVFLGQIGPQALNNSFWVKVSDALFEEEKAIKIDWTSLNEDFKEKEKAQIADKGKPLEAVKTTREGILEDKKVNQFEIILSRFQLTPDQAREALINLNIGYDQASQVWLLLPEEDVSLLVMFQDCNRILEWQGNEETLAVATKVVRDLLKIPRVKIRVKCIIAKYEFAVDAKILADQIREYKDPFEALLLDQSLLHFLNTILRTFNYLNHGSNKAEAPGFSLDTVRTVDKVLSTKKYSLLSLIVKWVHDSDSRKLSFVDQYNDLPKAMRYSLQDFEKQRGDLAKNISAVESELSNAEKCIQTLSSKPEKAEELRSYKIFKDYFGPFVEEAKFKLDTLQADIDKIKSKSSKCAEYYGLTSNFPPDQLLVLMQTFIETVKKNLQNILRQEIAAKKKAEYEQKLLQGTNKMQIQKQVADSHVPRPVRPVLRSKVPELNVRTDQSHVEMIEQKVPSNGPQLIKPSTVAGGMPIIRPQVGQTRPAGRPTRQRAQVKVDEKYKKKGASISEDQENNEPLESHDISSMQLPRPSAVLSASRMTKHVRATVNNMENRLQDLKDKYRRKGENKDAIEASTLGLSELPTPNRDAQDSEKPKYRTDKKGFVQL